MRRQTTDENGVPCTRTSGGRSARPRLPKRTACPSKRKVSGRLHDVRASTDIGARENALTGLAQGAGRQTLIQTAAIPIDELLHAALGHVRERTRLISGAARTDLNLPHDFPILLVRRQPYSSQLTEIIVDPLDGVAVYQPLRGERSARRAHG